MTEREIIEALERACELSEEIQRRLAVLEAEEIVGGRQWQHLVRMSYYAFAKRQKSVT